MTIPDARADEPPAAVGGFFGDEDDSLEALPEDVGPDTRLFDRHRVTAVLVAHDGARWLPRSLAALRSLTLAPAHVVAVDTGSTDATPALLQAGVQGAVLRVPRETGFGAAVAAGVASLAPLEMAPPASPPAEAASVGWLWLLHDDSAPEPEALRRLLAVADSSPSIAILGPKVVGWSDRRRLVQVGLSMGRGGRRETGLERGELDQGQRDRVHDVLAVGSSGLLVRRDVFAELKGFDPALVLFREDLDLGWRANLAGHRVVVVPDAVVQHAEAMSHGRRRADAVGHSTRSADRRSALHVLLANEPARALPWLWVRLVVASLARAVGLVLAKAPADAGRELLGAASVLLRPWRVVAARRFRRGQRRVPPSALRPLRPPRLAGLRHGLDAAVDLVSGRTDLSAGGSMLESGPMSDDVEPMDARGAGRVRALLGRPGALVFLGLLLVALAAMRGLLYGAGVVRGGALLGAPGGAVDLWRSVGQPWHDVGVGSGAPAAASLVPLAALATLLLGKAVLAVDLLLLLAVPLSGLVAYLVLGRLVGGRWTRLAAAVGYALLPAVTGAVASGRLGTATAGWLLPLAGLLAVRSMGSPGVTRASGSWWAAWAAGLLLAVVAAFVPLAWPVAALLGLLGLPWAAVSWPGAIGRLLAILAGPLLLLAPWIGRLWRDPALFLLEAGVPSSSLTDPTLAPWSVALANPGGPGVPPVWATAGLLLGGSVGLLRADRRRAATAAWAVVVVGVALGLVGSSLRVTPPSLGVPVPVWPGLATLLVGGGLVVAATLAGQGARERLSGHRFGWRQPVSALVGLLGLAVPVLLGAAWLVRGAPDPLSRGPADVLPAFVVASSEVPTRPRTLVVASDAEGTAGYALVPASGRRIGDADVAPAAGSSGPLPEVVADLLAGRADAERVGQLAGFGVAFVQLSAPVDPGLERAVDGVPGLSRVGAPTGSAVWRLDAPGVRVAVRDGDGTRVAVPTRGGTGPTAVDTVVDPGDAGRTLVLAEAADPVWRASLGGRPLTPLPPLDGWAQAFALPESGGRLVVEADGWGRRTWLVAQSVALAVVALLAVPGRRRDDDVLDDDVDLPDGAAGPREPGADAVAAR